MNKRDESLFDICVVGGGMVGSAMALGLGQLGFSVALIEPNKPEPFVATQPPDMRVSAISLASEKLLLKLGAWQHLQSMRLCAYQKLSVWEQDSCRTDFDSNEINQSHLGHIVENRMVQLALHQSIAQQANIQCFWQAKVLTVKSAEISTLTLADQQIIQSKVLIAADGGNSMIRASLNIGSQGWQYKQQALGINIKTHSPQQNITWQQFTSKGPVAFLPLYEGYAALVWYQSPAYISLLKGLSKAQLKEQIVKHFPAQLVDFEVLQVASFPLTRMHANQYYKGNTVLIGDAAHTINPLAGQGVNLGFKDVQALLAAIQQGMTQWGTEQVLEQAKLGPCLQQYERSRRRDNLLTMSAMDLLYSSFSNDHLPLSLIRNFALKVANHAGPIKRQAIKYAIGL
jgi:2-octaprenyl-3-methyl-6-methoxy-1,4-benzoquinol hydroxylase